MHHLLISIFGRELINCNEARRRPKKAINLNSQIHYLMTYPLYVLSHSPVKFITYGSAHGRSRIKNGSSVRLMKFLLVTWAGLSVLIMACVCPVATADRTRPWRTLHRPFFPRAQGQVKISSHSSCMAA
jgi:hypothetical protein